MTHARFALPLLLSFSMLVHGACNRSQAKAQSAAPPPATASPGASAFLSPAEEPTKATGTVLETMNASGYTYVRLQTPKEEVWIAATEFPVKKGDRLTVLLEMPMRDFHSKALNRDFPVIYFVPALAKEGQPLPSVGADKGDVAHGGAAPATPATTVIQPMAPPPGGLSIADVLATRASLAGKSVVVRGRVVKVNNGIMDRNWFHLQDGSGSAEQGTNDLTVTTSAMVALGDVVTVTGVLSVNKNLGAGYLYDAIIEQATVTR